MSKIQYAFILIFIPVAILAQDGGIKQDTGIKFEEDLSWPAVLAKAKAERKPVFIDCYTTWCAPCRHMSREIFTQKVVGEFFNTHFVNVSVQMDRTEKDAEIVRQWYEDADSIAAKFGVKDYPTFLVFSPDGEAIDRFVGSMETSQFLKRATDAMDPMKQYYTLVNHYKDHLGDSSFLYSAFIMAINSYDNVTAFKIGENYLYALQNPFSVENIRLMLRVDAPTSSKLFQFFLMNASRIDEILGDSSHVVEDILCRELTDERVVHLFDKKDAVVDYHKVLLQLQNQYPTLSNSLTRWVDGRFKRNIQKLISADIFKEGAPSPNWKLMAEKMGHLFPEYDCSLAIDELQPVYYEFKKMWSQCDRASLAFLDRYGNQLGAEAINKITWYYLFMYSSDPKVLKIALKWSKRAVDMRPDNCSYIDTYANLLYKTGDRKHALEWEKMAVEKNVGGDEEIRSNFEKMKSGKITWMDIDHKKS
jgi:thiol-disulfide isomerase/thioredoxin